MFHQGRYPEALDIFQRALDISESSNDGFGIGAGLAHIGNIHLVQGQYDQARSYLLKALKIAETIRNENEQANYLTKIGRSYLQQGYLDSASLFYNRVYKLIPGKSDVVIAEFWKDMGKLQAKEGRHALGMKYFRNSLPYAINRRNSVVLSETFLGIADLYRKAGQIDSSIYYGRKALDIAQRYNNPSGILTASQLLSELYERINEHQAFQYHKLATVVKDSLFNTEKANQIHNLFYVEQQRQQNLALTKREYTYKIRLYSLVSTLIFLLVLAVLLYRNNQSKQRANELLHRQKEEIEAQRLKAEQALENLKLAQTQLVQREKMASLGELTAGIAHEIQNPLNFVNNLSEVSGELVDELVEEAKAGHTDDVLEIAGDLKETLVKVNHHGKRADAIVKGMLQHSKASTGQKEPTDLNQLAEEYLKLAYHGIRAKDQNFNADLRLNLDTNLSPVNLIQQDFGRVLLNLYNNALYAVQQKQKQTGNGYLPQVEVTTYSNNGKVELHVKDNGTGIPAQLLNKIYQPFFTTKPTGEGTGLGLSLTYDIITKGHGGELNVQTEEGQYTEFVVSLPATQM
ncbi:hypothetical protein GCM10023189_56480 [Nibrella saemangeumensis]|uniref:histidine kinase n=1 Tax=Nibrella saemangeumensis TaxID=1084526 RepID=A0ABP8NR27_9BACT